MISTVPPQAESETEGICLTSGKLLARNTVINFLGRVAPLIVAVFALPILIKSLGTERFGLLTLIWVVIGYFSIFDLGLGRALTKFVSEKLGKKEEDGISPLVWTGLLLMVILGLAGAAVVAWLAPWLVQDVLRVPAHLHLEALRSFYLLALSIPIVISTSGLIGILESQQRFGRLNAVRIMIGVYMYASPLCVLPFSNSLVPMVAVLAVGRVLSWAVYFFVCLKTMPSLRQGFVFRSAEVKPLLSFGGWITISNIVDPVMVYLDRFLLASMVSISVVAYYTTPHEVVTKLLMFPAALVGVFFPAFSFSAEQDPRRTELLFERALKSVLLILFPAILLFVLFAPEILELWLGQEFAQNSAPVWRWLTIGVLINGLAYIPAILIQALGKPDLTGKLHLMELPVYLIVAWWMIGAYGIAGAALAWVARASIDLILMCAISRKLFINISPVLQRVVGFSVVGISLMVLAMLPSSLIARVILFSLILLAFAITVWRIILSPHERALAKNYLKTGHLLKAGY